MLMIEINYDCNIFFIANSLLIITKTLNTINEVCNQEFYKAWRVLAKSVYKELWK